MNDDVIAQLVKLGAPDSVIDAARSKSRPVDIHFYVWEENWPLVTMFLDLKGDWRVAVGMTGIVYFGLDSTAVRSMMEMHQVPPDRYLAVLRDLHIMADAALPLLNKPNE